MSNESTLHSQIFESFITNLPDMVYAMKSCDHGLNIHKPNPYHLEGDVWTHTCIAYQSLLYMEEFHQLDTYQQILACLGVLCHDLGKPYVKKVNDVGRCRFTGHEKRSVVETINIVDYLESVHMFNSLQIYQLLCIVSAHSEYWLRDSMQDVFPLLNYDEYILDVYKLVAMADQNGQIKSVASGFNEGKKSIFDFEFDLTIPEFNGYDDKPTVYVFTGAPACGKDTFINSMEETNIKIVSYDELRIRLYSAANDIEGMSSNDLYSNAWKWCNDTKVNLDNYMYPEIGDMLKNGWNVAISNTNMTIKGRKKIFQRINELGEYNIVVVFIYSDEYDLIERDTYRKDKDKSVGAHVIHRMYNNLEVPTLAEGFINIIPILNRTNVN